MNMPFALPDWVPWWVPLVLIVPTLLYVLAFLFMPFSVLGVKTRLEVIEARLDEIQQEIRHVALRLPMGAQPVNFEDVYAPIPAQRQDPAIGDRPPIPPAAQDLYAAEDLYYDDETVERPPPPANTRPARRDEPPTPRQQRAEPRFDGRR